MPPSDSGLAPNFEPNFEPQALGYHHNNHGNNSLWADFDPLLSPASTSLLRLSSLELDNTGDSAGSNGNSLPCNKNTSLHVPTTNMASFSECAINDNPLARDEPLAVTAVNRNVGALQQVITPKLQDSRGRARFPVNLKFVIDCKCIACRDSLYRGPYTLDHGVPRDEAHSWIELCDISDCDSRYGIRRVPDTEHLFKTKVGHRRDLSCCCAAAACNFVSDRWCDLRRHHVTKHCINPKRYPCPEPFCVYGGENGFKRLDKLKDHHRKVHEEKLRPIRIQRPLQSAATKPTAE